MNLAAQQLPDLTGKTRLEARIVLNNHSFQFKSCTTGGYETYDHPDGSVIHLRPNGEIVHLFPARGRKPLCGNCRHVDRNF
ncbi:hypothetical protein [Scytonema sp. PRP1]|uniref:hypothetical protein n=1 Tax=Scytonema sp. PRP1 TaxID=3120513 RepID=UPI002FD1C6DB